MATFRCCSPVLAATLLLAGVGCARNPVGVSGVVTMDGKPLYGALVTFLPTGKGRSAMATTQEDGSFTLSTLQGVDAGAGVWPGAYKVTVHRAEYPDPGTPHGPKYPDGLQSEEDYMRAHAKLVAEQKKKPSPWAKVPNIYNSPSTTLLPVIRVPTDGPVHLELGSKADENSSEPQKHAS
jgi:hypothetical protein